MRNITTETLLDTLIDFALDLKFEDLPQDVVREAKRHLLDAIGCMMGGLEDPGVGVTSEMTEQYQQTSWDRAYLNTHAIRALDWNDTYLSLEPAHPSDNIGTLLAIANIEKTSGKELITAMVIAYDIQCRFCDAASLRANGWDHTYYVQIASAIAAGRLFGLSREEMHHAASLAMRKVPLRQIRAGTQLSMAKGDAAAEAVHEAVWAVIAASYGKTGPSEMIEGEFGMVNQVTGPLRLEAFEGLGESFKLPQTYIKLYPVEYHAQAVVDVALRLRESVDSPENIESITIRSYEQALGIIGDQNKRRPETKESADHSIYYILAVTLLDGEMTLRQYDPARFTDPAVLSLIDKMGDVVVIPEFDEAYAWHEFPVLIEIKEAGKGFVSARTQFPKGHPKNPLSDEELEKKFRMLCKDVISDKEQARILKGIKNLVRKSDVAKLI